MKLVKWAFSGIAAFLIFYLGTVWVWANSAAPYLLGEISPGDPAAELRPDQVEALIRVEDPSFFDHHGLDISNGQGLTTITSSVARTLFLGNHQLDGLRGSMQSLYRAVFNCCKRIDIGRDIMALVLDSHATKQEQLRHFVGGAYLGSFDGKAIVGFTDAAQAYFGKTLAELTNDEFLGIVAMLLAPNHYHPVKNPRIHAQRVERVKAVVKGDCEPDGWLDLTYDHCATDV